MNAPTVSRHAVLFIVVTVAIDAISFGIIMPVLPQLIMELTGDNVGGAAFYIGWMWLAYAGVLFFCAPIIGGLSDRFGRRPVLLLALFTLGIDYLIMAGAPTIGWLFLGRAIAGIAGGSYSTANAYIADISTGNNRAQNFGMLGAAFGFGFIVGPVIGGLLGELGPRAPFCAAAVLSLVNVLYGFFVLKESLTLENRRPFSWRRANSIGSLVHLKSNPVVFGLSIALFLYMFGHFSLPTVWTVYTLEKFHWSEYQIGLSLGVAGVGMIVVQAGLIRWLIPKLGAPRAGMLGLLIMTISFFGYAFSVTDWQLYAWLIIAALAGIVTPAFQGVMTSQVAANSQGELQGAIACMNSLITVFAPLVMTRLFGYFVSEDAPVYFPGVSFALAGVLTFVALLIFVAVVTRTSSIEVQPEKH